MVHPKVFKVSFVDDQHHRISTCGGLDSEFSHTTREPVCELVVAPDLETAQFLWSHRGRLITSRSNIDWEEVGDVSLMFTEAYGL